MKLSRTVAFHEGETPGSFAARLAAANGVPPRDFARDMALSLPAIDAGEAEALGRLAVLSGLEADVLADSAIHDRDGGLWFRGLKVGMRNLARQRPRVCPGCLRDDIAAGAERQPAARPWYRTAWLVPAVRTCVRHRCLLVEPGPSLLRHPFLLPDLVRRSPGWIGNAPFDAAESPLEDWLSDRLAGGRDDPGLLDAFPLYVSAKLAQMVGATLLHGNRFHWKAMCDSDRLYAGAQGFLSAHHSFGEFLAPLYAGWDQTRAIGASGLGGTILMWMQNGKKNADFADLRKWVREHAIDHLPLGPGDEFLGPVSRRRLHSIHTAARDYGLDPRRVRKLLAHDGAIGPEASSLTDLRVVFPVEAADGILRSASTGLFGDRTRIHLGMNRSQWQAVRAAGLLDTAFAEGGNIHRTYGQETLDAFLAGVRYRKGNGGADLVDVSRATKLTGRGCVEIIGMLQAGVLMRVGVDPGKRGFAGVLVDPVEIRLRSPARPKVLPGLTARQVAERLGVKVDGAQALIALRALPSVPFRSYGANKQSRLVEPADVDAFLAEHMSLPELVKRLGVESWPRHAVNFARDHGLAPTFKDTGKKITTYRRGDIEPLLAARGA